MTPCSGRQALIFSMVDKVTIPLITQLIQTLETSRSQTRPGLQASLLRSPIRGLVADFCLTIYFRSRVLSGHPATTFSNLRALRLHLIKSLWMVAAAQIRWTLVHLVTVSRSMYHSMRWQFRGRIPDALRFKIWKNLSGRSLLTTSQRTSLGFRFLLARAKTKFVHQA